MTQAAARQPFGSVSIAPAGTAWRLTARQRVPHPIDAVFDFFASARNLEHLTPGFLRFRIRRYPPDPLRTGSLIDYRLSLHGIPVWWRTQIEEWTPPNRFVDRQVRGPFRRWHHLHEFSADGEGTWLRDTVDFDVYCRPLYRTPALRWIDSDLHRIFEYRQATIAERFTSPPGP